MGHKNKKTLTKQIEERFTEMLRIGVSRHDSKLRRRNESPETAASKYIFSWNTYKTYMKHANYFTRYCKQQHGCRTLDECLPYANEWLETRQDLSPYTVKLEISMLCKMYQCKSNEFIKTRQRKRQDIKRSRGTKARDSHFSESNHKDLVEFCKSTGLRRNELKSLRGNMYKIINNMLYLRITAGTKGGKTRYVRVIGDSSHVLDLMRAAGDEKVFTKIPLGADIHGYRAEYANSLYRLYARPLNEIPYDKYNYKLQRYIQSGVYHCRNDKVGIKYDRIAMLKVSRSLGHNRVSIIASHYLNEC